MIENWRDLVGYQKNTRHVYYLVYTRDDEGKPCISIEKSNVECYLTEQKLCEKLDVILTSFPKSNMSKDRAANQIARQSRRGIAKTEYKRSIFYRGSASDAAAIVIERNGKFGIFKHPNFDQYGFTL